LAKIRSDWRPRFSTTLEIPDVLLGRGGNSYALVSWRKYLSEERNKINFAPNCN
jgi:hypothetical protein